MLITEQMIYTSRWTGADQNDSKQENDQRDIWLWLPNYSCFYQEVALLFVSHFRYYDNKLL